MTKTNNSLTEREFLSRVNLIIEKADLKNIWPHFDEEIDTMKEYIENRIWKMDERNANRKPTKKQQNNDVLRQQILDAMELNQPYTVTEITQLDVLADKELSTSKVSAVLRPLIANDISQPADEFPIFREKIKGQARYTKR